MPYYVGFVTKGGTESKAVTPYATIHEAIRAFRLTPAGAIADAWIEDETGKRVMNKAAIDASSVD